MDKFIFGFVFGAAIGAGLALLLTPDDTTRALRERVRLTTDKYAAGTETPASSVSGFIEQQKDRWNAAVEAGKRANIERQSELWSELQLPKPDEAASLPPTPLLP